MRRLHIPQWSGAVLAVLGLALMILGISRGELDIVFTKAINICLECVGIG